MIVQLIFFQFQDSSENYQNYFYGWVAISNEQFPIIDFFVYESLPSLSHGFSPSEHIRLFMEKILLLLLAKFTIIDLILTKVQLLHEVWKNLEISTFLTKTHTYASIRYYIKKKDVPWMKNWKSTECGGGTKHLALT